jgi:hypothetical protein
MVSPVFNILGRPIIRKDLGTHRIVFASPAALGMTVGIASAGGPCLPDAGTGLHQRVV